MILEEGIVVYAPVKTVTDKLVSDHLWFPIAATFSQKASSWLPQAGFSNSYAALVIVNMYANSSLMAPASEQLP